MRKRHRREFLKATSLTSLFVMAGCAKHDKEITPMYGITGKMLATPGSRDELINILLDGTKEMPGCLMYVISKDIEDENGIWITEVWKDPNSHEASLALPGVQEAIQKGRPLIAGFPERHILETVGGHGL
jgi:quinol monooxygenase YgiN